MVTQRVGRPRMQDVGDRIGELLPAFDQDYLRRSFDGPTMTIVIGAHRERQMFPRSNRLRSQALVAWEQSTKVTLLAPEAFDVLFDPELAALMPYAVVPLQLFGRPLRSVLLEMQRRLGMDDDGFALLWIGSGGHVTPLHHDGPMVDGRWHLVVRGQKRFDLLPPRFSSVPRLPPWDLYRRFSPLYKSPLPDAWFGDRGPGRRFDLLPGQMVTWDRRWWHRVEIGRSDVTIAVSTRGVRDDEQRGRRATVERLVMRFVGDVESTVERHAPPLRIISIDDVRAMRVTTR
jgi:hypothetical protein